MEAEGIIQNKQIINTVLKQLDKNNLNNFAFQLCVDKNKSPESFLICKNKVKEAFQKCNEILKNLK
jgi:hypothetical protein